MQATPQDLNHEGKSKETLRQVLFYLFCAAKLGKAFREAHDWRDMANFVDLLKKGFA